MLKQDETAPVKQRSYGQADLRAFEGEFGYKGRTQARAYVSELKARPREAFVPLVSVPGKRKRTSRNRLWRHLHSFQPA